MAIYRQVSMGFGQDSRTIRRESKRDKKQGWRDQKTPCEPLMLTVQGPSPIGGFGHWTDWRQALRTDHPLKGLHVADHSVLTLSGPLGESLHSWDPKTGLVQWQFSTGSDDVSHLPSSQVPMQLTSRFGFIGFWALLALVGR